MKTETLKEYIELLLQGEPVYTSLNEYEEFHIYVHSTIHKEEFQQYFERRIFTGENKIPYVQMVLTNRLRREGEVDTCDTCGEVFEEDDELYKFYDNYFCSEKCLHEQVSPEQWYDAIDSDDYDEVYFTSYAK